MGTTNLADNAIIAQAGGNWGCTVHMGYCTQSSWDSPITWTTQSGDTPTPGSLSNIYLSHSISSMDDTFKGATLVPSTISFKIQVTAQGGSPSPLTLISLVGGASYTYPDVQYNTPSPISMSHSDAWNGPPPDTIDILLEAITSGFNGAAIKLEISDLSFTIHDVVYGSSSRAGSSSTSASLTSSSLLTSNPGSSPTASINGTSLSGSTSLTTTFTTTISGHQTVVGSILPQPSDSESQSHSPIPSSTPGSISTTASDHTGVIAGITASLIGLGVILIGIAFWYRWRRRRGMARSKETLYGDEQSGTYSDSRMVDAEPWVPRPYRNRPSGLAIENTTAENAVVVPVEEEGAEPAEIEGQEEEDHSSSSSRSSSSSWRTGDDSSGHASPPAYSQITPAIRSTSGRSSIQDG